MQPITPHPKILNNEAIFFCKIEWIHLTLILMPDIPMSSAGLLGLLLINVSKASFMALMNPSFRAKQL